MDNLVSQESNQSKKFWLPDIIGCPNGIVITLGFQQSKPHGLFTNVYPFTHTSQMVTSSPNSLKVNFDGATFKDIGRDGLGVVVRDNQGQALASLSEWVPFPSSSDLVEALVAVQAISFALEIGCLSFILEGDFERVINTLSNNEDSLSPFGHILDLAKALIESSCISFFHICWLGNSVARKAGPRHFGA